MVAGWSSRTGSCWNWGQALAALVACCGLAAGCSPRNSAADAAGLADAQPDVASDIGGDLADSGVDSATEVQDGQGAEVGDLLDTGGDDGAEVVDAITDVVEGDGDAAIDTAAPCTSTDIPAALTGTVEFDFSPLVPNNVVTGCGKGPPQPVKAGEPCCKCPPPYSCYCNGECGWLRAPDLVKPQHSGQAVWTGKWVVTLGEAYGKYQKPFSTEVMPGDMNLQRWQPGSGKGFELVPLPSPDFPAGHPVLYVLGEKVVVAVRYYASMEVAYTPSNPIYLYDPDGNVFKKVPMPVCGKLLLSGGTLVCVATGKSTAAKNTAGLHIYNISSDQWNLVQPPEKLLPETWWIAEPNNSTADAAAVYLVGGVLSSKAWPDGTTDFPGPTRHILKYEVLAGKWSDIGAVPVEWHTAPFAVDHIGIVAVKGAIQAARFRLDTFNWEVGPKAAYSQFGHQELTLTPCGLLFGSGTAYSFAEGGGMKYRPILLGPDLAWKLLSPWGYPDDGVTARKEPQMAITDKEVFAFGGMDGPGFNFVYHKDSYRYPLSAWCSNGGPK